MNVSNHKKFSICTSFNSRLLTHQCTIAHKYLPTQFSESDIYIFHENSYDKKYFNHEINFDKKPSNVNIIDLFKHNPWLENFIKNSHFKNLDNNDPNNTKGDITYTRSNSVYWFRKVVSIVNFIEMMCKEGKYEYGIWFDCDACLKEPLDDNFMKFIKPYDWTVFFRKKENGYNGYPIESGFQIFKFNEHTLNFAKKYLDYYLTEDVFKYEYCYADNTVLQSCIEKFSNTYNLNVGDYGLLRKQKQYEFHFKGPLRDIRKER